MVLLSAIDKAKTTDTEKVRDTLAGIEFEGVAGKITFDSEGDPIKTAAIIHVADGQKTFVKFVAP